MSKLTLLTLTTVVAISTAPLTVYAQSTDSRQDLDAQVEEILAECDAILNEMAAQRDAAIRNADAIETERDEVRGALKQMWPELEDLRDENQVLRLQVASQPSRLVWAGVGAGVALVVGGALIYVVGAF